MLAVRLRRDIAALMTLISAYGTATVAPVGAPPIEG